jgi:hypothetical protein
MILMKNTTKLSPLLAVLVFVAGADANAQDCSRILGHIRDTTDVQASSQRYSSFRRFFCDQQFSSFQQASEAGVRVGVPVEGLPVEFGGHSRNSEWSEYRRVVCEAVRQDDFSASNLRVAVSRANDAVVAAWTSCINQAGFHFWAELNEDDSQLVVLRAKYVSSGPPYFTVARGGIAFQPEGSLRCTGDAVGQGTQIDSAGVLLNCARQSNRAVTVTLSTQHGGWPITIPAIRPMVATNPVPPWRRTDYRPALVLTAHIQDIGDMSGGDGAWIGTKGRGLRLEGFSINLRQPADVPQLGLEYMCHLQDSGDTSWISGGSFCGTRGQGRRVEGFAVRLTGENARHFSVVYECHLQDIGDVGPIQDGSYCGTRGQGRRVEAMRVYVVAK